MRRQTTDYTEEKKTADLDLKKESVPQPGLTVRVFKKDNVMVIIKSLIMLF
jgi:hypothetical protein